MVLRQEHGQLFSAASVYQGITTTPSILIYVVKLSSKFMKFQNSSICSLTSVSDTARCFSCMSRLYEAVWPALSSIYKRPKNFTDLCNDNDLDPQYVPFTYCPTICIRMWEEPTVAGTFSIQINRIVICGKNSDYICSRKLTHNFLKLDFQQNCFEVQQEERLLQLYNLTQSFYIPSCHSGRLSYKQSE